MRVLITGGAGYIGSVVCEELLKDGHDVIVLDSLVAGHSAAVPREATFIKADIADGAAVRTALRNHRVEAVIHMAADALVGESMVDPGKYYRNNVSKGIALLDALVECEVRRLVFSSTGATYGEATNVPIDEDHPTNPINPYGETKLAFERAMHWYEGAHGIRHCTLRYFNAAGATERNGEDREHETHIIPLTLQVAAGKLPHLTIHGDDYPTDDGTCVRDYIHVVDLARAHVLALGIVGDQSAVYNLGCGGGYSINQLVDVAREVTGREIDVKVGPRRPGDPAVLVASSERIKRELGWKPERESLKEIISSAWAWMQEHPNGYDELITSHE